MPAAPVPSAAQGPEPAGGVRGGGGEAARRDGHGSDRAGPGILAPAVAASGGQPAEEHQEHAMTQSIAAYITLPGNAAEAFRHWHAVFGGELEIITYGQMQLEGLPFDPPADAVAHAVLHLEGGDIAGGDSIGELQGAYPLRDTAYSLLCTETDLERARELSAGLVEAGGSENMPIMRAPWGDHYGQTFDRFGVMWSFSVPQDDPAERVL